MTKKTIIPQMRRIPAHFIHPKRRALRQTYLCTKAAASHSMMGKIKGCISHAPRKSRLRTKNPALVRPQAGQGKPVRPAIGHMLPNKIYKNIKQAIIQITAHFIFFISVQSSFALDRICFIM